MLHDLDATLAAMLSAELSLPNVSISFQGPDEQFPPSTVSLPAISLFLYDVRENLELRTNQWELQKQPDGRTTRRRAPARVDCSYLVTAWPSSSVPDPAGDEHRLLGEGMAVLLRHRSIPDTYLQGALRAQEPPVRTRVMTENQLQSIGEFWQAMGGRPKATLHYGVTVSVDVFEPAGVGPEVTEHVITLTREPAHH